MEQQASCKEPGSQSKKQKCSPRNRQYEATVVASRSRAGGISFQHWSQKPQRLSHHRRSPRSEASKLCKLSHPVFIEPLSRSSTPHQLTKPTKTTLPPQSLSSHPIRVLGAKIEAHGGRRRAEQSLPKLRRFRSQRSPKYKPSPASPLQLGCCWGT